MVSAVSCYRRHVASFCFLLWCATTLGLRSSSTRCENRSGAADLQSHAAANVSSLVATTPPSNASVIDPQPHAVIAVPDTVPASAFLNSSLNSSGHDILFTETPTRGTSNHESSSSGHEVELQENSMKSKVVLLLLEVGFLGCCGIDRCYMNQVLVGVCKGFTFGGLFIWGFIDYVVVVINCLAREDEIDRIGFKAKFNTQTFWGFSDVTLAFYIALIVLFFNLCCGGRAKAAASTSTTGAVADTALTNDDTRTNVSLSAGP